MYQAAFLAVGLVLIYVLEFHILRRFGTAEVLKGNMMFMHYTTWLYLLFAYLTFRAVQTTHYDIMLPTHFLDPSYTEKAFKATVLVDQILKKTKNATLDLERWRSETSLEGYDFLRWFSMSGCIWMSLTFLICSFHTILHLKAVRRRQLSLFDCAMHDLTIQILGLPMVYGIMSYKAITRSWQIMMNRVLDIDNVYMQGEKFQNWGERRFLLENLAESNFMVGDLYEGFALLTFGNLVMRVINAQIDLSGKGEAKKNSRQTAILVTAVSGLTTDGIFLFFATCFLNAAVVIFAGFMSFSNLMPHYFSCDPKSLGTFYKEPMKTSVTEFFLGAGFVASFAAIGNIMKVEHIFHSFLKEFGPFWKFWGTKILVTIAFMQSGLLSVLPPTSSWSDDRRKLMYASLMCFECFIVSVMHLLAWSADSGWYDADLDDITWQAKNELRVQLLRHSVEE